MIHLSAMKFLRYLVPNSITVLALTCGVIASVHGANGNPIEGTWWVLYATILDRLDGVTARALNASSTLGVWLDSASDFVAFGVAPAFLFLGTSPSGFELWMAIPMSVYIIGCGARLLRFSLQEAKEEFSGAPSTLAGGVYAVGLNTALIHGLSGADHQWLFASVLIAFGIAMNTPWLHYAKVGGVSTRWLNILGVSAIATCAVLILFRALPEVVFAASGIIMLTAPLISRFENSSKRV